MSSSAIGASKSGEQMFPTEEGLSVVGCEQPAGMEAEGATSGSVEVDLATVTGVTVHQTDTVCCLIFSNNNELYNGSCVD